MTPSTARSPLRRGFGLLILVLSAVGYPLTRLVVRRLGRRGAVLAEGIAAILLVRDAALVAVGTPAVLRPAHARLLYLELAAAIAATLTGLRPVVGRGTASSVGPPGDALELVRRTSMVVLFAIHTVRFWVYLQPDHGLKEDRADHGQSINWRAHTMRPSWRVGDSRYRTKRATERGNRAPADPALP